MNLNIGILLSYPEGLLDAALDKIEKAVLEELRKTGEPFITINMPCGERFVVEKRSDFPTMDVPCSCGNKTHFFIKHNIQKSRMQMENVVSSNIEAIGYDEGEKILRIKFHNQKVFEYSPVEKMTWASMMEDDSKGGFFAQRIRPFYKAKRVDDGKGGIIGE